MKFAQQPRVSNLLSRTYETFPPKKEVLLISLDSIIQSQRVYVLEDDSSRVTAWVHMRRWGNKTLALQFEALM